MKTFFDMRNHFSIVLCIAIIYLGAVATPVSGQSNQQKQLYMLGYCYGGTLLSLSFIEQYQENEIILLKLALRVQVYSEEMLAILSKPEISKYFKPAEVKSMQSSLEPLTKVLSEKASISRMKAQFMKFDAVFTPYISGENEFVYFVSLGVYQSQFLCLDRPLINEQVMVPVWEDNFKQNSAKYKLPATVDKKIGEMVGLLKKYPASAQASAIQDKAKELHITLRTKKLIGN